MSKRVAHPVLMPCYVHGVTATPRTSFDIYRVPEHSAPILFSGEREPYRVDFTTTASAFLCRRERTYLKRRGHRHGAKGCTLRSHRAANPRHLLPE